MGSHPAHAASHGHGALHRGRAGDSVVGGVRQKLASFYAETEQLQAYSRDWVQMAAEYSDVAKGILDPELRVAIGSEFIYGEVIPTALAPDAETLARRIAQEPELLRTIGDVLLINKVSALTYAELDAKAREIRAMIAEELESGAPTPSAPWGSARPVCHRQVGP